MLEEPSCPRKVAVVGAGICGTWTALMLGRAGLAVTLHERGDADLAASASRWAGGMLAPGCEGDGAEPVVARLGRRSLDLWSAHLPDMARTGSLVICHPRDRAELDRFAARTDGHRGLDEAEIAALEPDLAGRFRTGLLFADEGHVEPRAVLPALRAQAERAGVAIRFGSAPEPDALAEADAVVDCRGLAARDAVGGLRGVKGETVLVETAELRLARPVRLMHPRWPIYVIPRPGHRFLIGASTIESEDAAGVSVRSALELMSAAFALHPALGEARIVELGAALRPAFPDNAPRIAVAGRRIAVNGLYRHGFLVAPALAEIVTAWVTRGARDAEVMRWS